MSENDMMVPMLNRGEIRWVPSSQVQERLNKGWDRWELKEPPIESYYPQYDKSKAQRQADERIYVQGGEDEIEEVLGLILI